MCLDRTLQVNIPDRDAINRATGQVGFLEVCLNQDGVVQFCAVEVCRGKVSFSQRCYGEVRGGEVCAGTFGSAEVCEGQVREAEVGFVEIGFVQVGIVKRCAREIGFMQVGSREVCFIEVGGGQVGPAEIHASQCSFMQFGSNIGIFLPPLIPGSNALLERAEVLSVCHVASLLK